MHAKQRKWFVTSAAVVLLASVLSACGNSNDNNSTNTSDASTSEGAANTNKEKVTLKVEVFDRGNAPAGAGPVTDNFWTQWIQTNFGDPNNIKLEFVPVPRNQEVDKLNVLMATGDAPDLVFTYDMNTIYNYVKDDGLIDLTSLIENAPNLKKFLGDEVLNYGVFNDKQYTIPAKRPLQYTQSTYIRKDWLDKLELPVPTTTEQFYETMKAFKEKDPGQTGGKVIPYDFSSLDNTSITSPFVLVNSFVNKMSEEEFYSLTSSSYIPEITKPGYKDGVQYLNKFYQEGLINPDFALDKDGKQFESDVANGYVGAFTALAAHPNLMAPGKVFDTLKQNVPGAEYIAIDPFTDEEGKTPKSIYDPIGMHIMIPKTSKHAAEAIKYLDWMSQSDVLFTLQNGMEGQHYTLENGFPKAITTDEAKKTFYNNTDIAIIANGKDFGSIEKDIEATSYQFPGYEEIAKQSIQNALKDGYSMPRFDRPIESEIKYGTTLKAKAYEIVVKSILAKPDQFNKIFDDGVKEYLKLGGQAIQDERLAAYQEMKK
ncbi:putative aldouronate transport system substrate-binding protein [Paenibacillus phyllosphaerae]|uniref:Putative aldouronate transport system substrate-binding protein n=1 Tax=Paenibacillus phyllosphaerae TaxID=274593 RepID=A0A7W5AU00_9BACL|nr:extracellular solute-binding protein [Paenibacillus phyllosphaerae]MBB3108111.1 putative aldouronate transport system substrate-binding protein [Paenibacillus phyllosphaerae]